MKSITTNLSISDILEDAINQKKLEMPFTIHIGNHPIDVRLSNLKWTDITKQQRIKYTQEYSVCCQAGLDKQPISEKEWNEQVSRLKEAAEKSGEKFDESTLKKPENRAEQLAGSFALIETILSLVPKAFTDESGNPVFSENDLLKVRQAIDLDNRLFSEIFTIYGNFSKLVDEQEKSVKN